MLVKVVFFAAAAITALGAAILSIAAFGVTIGGFALAASIFLASRNDSPAPPAA